MKNILLAITILLSGANAVSKCETTHSVAKLLSEQMVENPTKQNVAKTVAALRLTLEACHSEMSASDKIKIGKTINNLTTIGEAL